MKKLSTQKKRVLPILFFIRIYQKTLSPDHGWFRHKYPFGFCPYTPTCSEYGFQSFQKYGIVRGLLKTAWRILRCHPWTKGGYDAP